VAIDADLDLDFDAGDDLAALGGTANPDEELAGLTRARETARLRAEADARPPDPDAELAAIQGVVAGVAPPEPDAGAVSGTAVAARTITLNGKKFRIADKVGLMPLLKFSAFSDMTTSDSRALGAMYAMLRDCIHADDWRAFEDHATDSKADAEELLDVISTAIELISGRPTEPPAASSAGRRSISGGSTGSSSSRRGRGSRR
jgi:hypothetical protein